MTNTTILHSGHVYKSTLLSEKMRSDPHKMKILQAVSSYREAELWIAGGFVRNLVWDDESTDVDVYYYDAISIVDKQKEEIKREEKLIQDILSIELPEVTWSVRNQARMHINNNEIQYSDLFDAIKKQTETASAVAMRLIYDEIYFLAPYTLNDLINKVVKPTPRFSHANTIEKFFQRVINKGWFNKSQLKMPEKIKKEFDKYMEKQYDQVF